VGELSHWHSSRHSSSRSSLKFWMGCTGTRSKQQAAAWALTSALQQREGKTPNHFRDFQPSVDVHATSSSAKYHHYRGRIGPISHPRPWTTTSMTSLEISCRCYSSPPPTNLHALSFAFAIASPRLSSSHCSPFQSTTLTDISHTEVRRLRLPRKSRNMASTRATMATTTTTPRKHQKSQARS